MNLDRVGRGRNPPKEINVIIEIPLNGEPVKYELDKETGAMFVDRFLNTAMRYPCNYGYVPKTLSLDGDPVDVMKGMDADCPSKPFGGDDEITFTPDGKSIVFSARDAGNTEAWSTNFDLYVSPIDGSAKPKIVTTDNKAWDTLPVFSPDGKTLAVTCEDKQVVLLHAP